MNGTLTKGEQIEMKMRSKERKGCFVTETSGFILLSLVVVLAVGVGLIVYFTSTKSGTTHFNCIYPAATPELNEQTKYSQIQLCHSLGEKENKCKYTLQVVSHRDGKVILVFTMKKSVRSNRN